MDITTGTTYSISIDKPAGKNYAKARKHFDWTVRQIQAANGDSEQGRWVVTVTDDNEDLMRSINGYDNTTVTVYETAERVDRW